jgi:hypothetical protein
MKYTSPELIRALAESFKPEKKVKQLVAYRISFNGHFITTLSGKTVWAGIGPAKLALTNHIQYCTEFKREWAKFYKIKPLYNNVNYLPIDGEKYRLFLEELQTLGILRFVPVDSSGFPLPAKSP